MNSWRHSRSTTERGYGWRWQRLRKRILARDQYLCVPCRKAGKYIPAEAVDHIKPKADGGTDDPENLRAICDPCHLAKSMADQGKKPRRKRQTYGLDGWPTENQQ